MEAFGLSFEPVTRNFFVDQLGRAANYSDGWAEEKRLLDIVGSVEDLSSTSWQLHNSANSWVDRYHFSVHRGAIVRCLPFVSSKRVLEMGAGCGAITRALGERFHQVNAIEGTVERARICAKRCEGLPNVRVFAADINRIAPEPVYDLVFLIGVLEWSKGFIKGANPFQHCLNIASRALKPNGCLIVAIENQIGLKYFLGAGEDHCGTPMEGLHGYPNFDKAATFARLQLSRILKEAGCPNFRFMYPFPDYKLAKVVLTDEAVSLCSESIAYWASRYKFEDYQAPGRDNHGNQLLVASEVAKAGLLGELSNSFLVIAGKDKTVVDHIPWLVWSERLTRNAPLCSTTTLEHVNGKLLVKKVFSQPFPEEESLDEFRFKLNPPPLQPFFDGTSIEIELLRCAVSGRSLDLVQIVNEWMSYAGRRFKSADGNLQSAAWDCIPRNLVRIANGEMKVFDLEFTRSRTFTLPELCGRGLLCWFCEHAPWAIPLYPEATTIRAKILSILNKVFGSIDPKVTLDSVVQSEIKFQQWVNAAATLDIEGMLNSPIRRGDFRDDIAERLRAKEDELSQLREHASRLQLFEDAVRQTWAYRAYRQFVKPLKTK
jgi:SAM-dependent methyltransferase